MIKTLLSRLQRKSCTFYADELQLLCHHCATKQGVTNSMVKHINHGNILYCDSCEAQIKSNEPMFMNGARIEWE